MNRRMMIAALTAIGAASFAVAPSYAQQQPSALEAKIGTEAPAPRAGALPMPALKLGERGVATEQAAQASSSSAAPKLQMAPSADVPIVNK
jgi:hypothetical protein